MQGLKWLAHTEQRMKVRHIWMLLVILLLGCGGGGSDSTHVELQDVTIEG